MKLCKVVDNDCLLLDFLVQNLDVDRHLLKRQIALGECKIDGKKVCQNQMLNVGSKVVVFVPDSFLVSNKILLENIIVYDDDNIVVVDKPQGLTVDSLQQIVRQKYKDAFLTHRLDRNTQGLIVLAKSQLIKELLTEATKDGQIKKYYVAKVYGQMQGSGVLKVFLFKDAKKSIVYVSDTKKVGYKEAITKYNTISSDKDSSTVELQLITGRTHQIRATLAHFGHFVIGDGKYGNQSINRKYGCNCQQLKAIRVEFVGLSGKLEYLNNLTLQVNPLQ